MTIRKKLSILLLAMAVIPAAAVILTFEISVNITRQNISNNFQKLMDQKATMVLQQQLGDFAARLALRGRLLDEILLAQCSDLNDLSIDTDTDSIAEAKTNLTDNNSIQIANNITAEEARRDSFVLNELIDSCVRFELPENHIYRHIFILADGSMGFYPVAAEQAESRLNPIACRWYQQAQTTDEIISSPPALDVNGQRPVFTLARSVSSDDGKQLGVIALEIDLNDLFDGLKVNEQWSANSIQAIVAPTPEYARQGGPLRVITRNKLAEIADHNNKPVTLRESFEIDDQTNDKIQADILGGEGGLIRASFDKIDSICLYQPAGNKQTAALLIIPYENIISSAASIEKEFFSHSIREFTGFFIIITLTVLCAIVLAVYRARNITEPLTRLSEAGARLSRGEFYTQVDIRTGDEIQALGEVFNQIGPHLAQRQSMQESLELARSIQKNLLPTAAPQIAGYDIAGLCCYCDETGGDYYDYIPAADNSGRTLLALGDVTGHGIAAALLMASARSLMRSLVSHCCSDLGELLGSFNRHFLADTDGSRFITMFCCVLNPQDNQIFWASGGHDPAILYSPQTDSFTELGSTGMLLGVIEEARYTTRGPTTLASDDIMLIGTDGIWEAPNPYGELFGKDRLKEIIKQYASEPAATVAENILTEIKSFCGDIPARDDITMIVVKRKKN